MTLVTVRIISASSDLDLNLSSSELGILVWQDFCGFACGVYPNHTQFVEQVTEEAEANVKSLQHHPSIIMWCGNNEDYQQILQWGGAFAFTV